MLVVMFVFFIIIFICWCVWKGKYFKILSFDYYYYVEVKEVLEYYYNEVKEFVKKKVKKGIDELFKKIEMKEFNFCF